MAVALAPVAPELSRMFGVYSNQDLHNDLMEMAVIVPLVVPFLLGQAGVPETNSPVRKELQGGEFTDDLPLSRSYGVINVPGTTHYRGVNTDCPLAPAYWAIGLGISRSP